MMCVYCALGGIVHNRMLIKCRERERDVCMFCTVVEHVINWS